MLIALALLAMAQKAPPPIVRSQAYPVERIGDWQVKPLDDGAFAATTFNTSGHALSVICGRNETCKGYFNPKVECENGEPYPGLVNSPGGSFNVIFECLYYGDGYTLEFELSSGIIDSMSVGGVIGLAFPMQSGEFRVSRHSLTGAARAVARANQLANGANPPQQTPSELRL